eukprot:1182328-Prorocentrum_minimum.AAC.2
MLYAVQQAGSAGAVQGQCRGSAGAVQGQCRGSAGAVQGQCRPMQPNANQCKPMLYVQAVKTQCRPPTDHTPADHALHAGSVDSARQRRKQGFRRNDPSGILEPPPTKTHTA